MEVRAEILQGCPPDCERGGPVRRMLRIALGIFFAITLLAPGRVPLRAQANSERAEEYLIKAAFLCNFAKFVESSPEALSSEHSPIIIGILGDLPEILANLRGADVLTVGETKGFAPGRGIIQFTLRENRARLMVNVEAAKRARLKISFRLLALAEITHDDPRGGRS